MLRGIRFRAYRTVVARATQRDFDHHETFALELPGDEFVNTRILDGSVPRLFVATSFPETEHAQERIRSALRVARLRPLVARLPAARSGPVSDDLGSLLSQVYPRRYRKLWGTPPATPPEFDADDPLAALAVSSPFGLYLQRASSIDRRPAEVDPSDFVLDMRLFDRYPVKEGLFPPGGMAVFAPSGRRLATRGVWYGGLLHGPDSSAFPGAQRLLLCALNTHLTTMLHNAMMHLGYVTPFAVASTNYLPPDHPLRRLLHPALHTTVVGNYQIAHFQMLGPHAFGTTIFSHESAVVAEMIDDALSSFRIADFDPEHRTDRDGLRDAPIDLPLLEDRRALWEIVLRFAERYVRRHYADDRAVAQDTATQRWLGELDRLLPAGLYDDQGYLPPDEPIGVERLTRICATFLHVSSVTHDIVNNAVWNYAPLNHLIPTQVPASGEPQDVRATFDLVTTLIGTWKPYNLLIDGVSELALDDVDRTLMDDYVGDLRRRQEEISGDLHRPGRIRPDRLNPSVSN